MEYLEHLVFNYRSSIRITSTCFCVVRNHKKHQNYNLTTNQFKIVSSANTDFELSLREILLIKNLKHSLNDMKSLNLNVF